MAAALVCAVTAALNLSTNRGQYFTDSRFKVSCPLEWSVFRNTSLRSVPSQCAPPWGRPLAEGCNVGPTQRSHTGSYWCQSKDRLNCTEAFRISVSDRGVILGSPLFPLKEGQSVNLTCSYRAKETDKSTSDFEAAFFRDNTFLGSFPGGRMELKSVSKEKHQGRYKCEHPTKEQSVESQLIVLQKEQIVTTPSPQTTPAPQEMTIELYRILCFSFLFLLYTAILFIGLFTYCKWTRAQAEEKKQQLERVSLRRVRNP